VPEPLRLPRPLSPLPWDIAQFEFGVKGTDFIGVLGQFCCAVRNPSSRSISLTRQGFPAHFPLSGAIPEAPCGTVRLWGSRV
jgi:hypothetical protein